MDSILIGGADQQAAKVIRDYFRGPYRVEVAPTRTACLEMFRRRRYEYTFVSIDLLKDGPLGQVDFRRALEPFWEAFPTAPVIVMAGPDQTREAVEAVKSGADDYLVLPVNPAEVGLIIDNLSRTKQVESELAYLRDSVWGRQIELGMRTESPVMRQVLGQVKSVASTRSTVLLTGETGTGKNLMAKVIHGLSNRADGPFVAVHCGAVPDTLLESELFGHEKGAFTGAVRRKMGRFEIAHQGTIFLDEVGTLTLAAQVKLLTVIQEKSFNRVGGEVNVEVDVRIVAATNLSLEELVTQGLFRKDLYYRLNVFPIELPPLRQRNQDVPVLVDNLIRRFNRIYGKGIKGVRPEVMDALSGYAWPGNIRELENLVERAYILETSPMLTADTFPAELMTIGPPSPSAGGVEGNEFLTLAEARRRGVEDIERQYLINALTAHQGRIDRTARAAGITPRQLHKLMTKYGLRKEDFKS